MAADCKTLQELIEKVGEAAPMLDDKVADILRRYPELGANGFALGRIVAIGLLDFLCWAFDRPDLGYLPPWERGDDPFDRGNGAP